MKKLLFLVSIFTFIACQQHNPQEQLQHIDGYWEIERVERDGKVEKEYKFNETVDFFDFEKNEGLRKKAKPQLDGSFIVANSGEKITAKVENDSLRLHYNNAFDEWTETVLKADEDELVIKGKGDLVYHYKKFKGYLEHEEVE